MILMLICCHLCCFIVIQNYACPFCVIYDILELLECPFAVLCAVLERQKHTHLPSFMLLYDDFSSPLLCLNDGDPPLFFTADGKTILP